ncbi:hypothetical protein NP233_g9185 [Leucocoprinus birnbaumii]|uniref:F-box domain-containing protein n=1 Tax=Leucocoprinus birnbaumii TaxID=56174 RepID=A0AAD5VL71_9AGAR|nr:hypothetical protein NP233_g9185 [Leucocoprinus birnbaumii]
MARNRRKNKKAVLPQTQAPIGLDLPYDVLSEIFLILWAQSYTCVSQAPFLPTRLGAVSTFWRHVAWLTPQLWTDLELTNSFWWSKDRLYILNLYLKNVGNSTLNLTIEDYPSDLEAKRSGKSRKGRSKRLRSMASDSDPFPSSEFIHVIPFPARDVFTDIFVRHPEKLKSVVMEKYVYSWLQEIEAISQSSGFPNLETFSIDSDIGDDPAQTLMQFGTIAPPVDIQNVPQLQNISLVGPRVQFSFPWSQILSLHLIFVDAVYAMQAVLGCPNLQDLQVSELDISPVEDDFPFPRERLDLPALDSFLFAGFSVPYSWEVGLTQYLSFSGLKNLRFEPSPLSFERHADFLRNLPSTLETLFLFGDSSQEFVRSLTELLTRSVHLEKLAITFSDPLPHEFLRYVTLKPRQHPVLPALADLTFILLPASNKLERKRYPAILKFLRSRWGMRCPDGVSPIYSFEIRLIRDRPPKVNSLPKNFLAGARELREEGMNIFITAAVGNGEGYMALF